MKIKIFSDMVCPNCYVGKLRPDQALERLKLTDVEVEFKAFQLPPTSPADYSMHKRAEGKHYRVAMFVAYNEFLRIYHSRVSSVLNEVDSLA